MPTYVVLANWTDQGIAGFDHSDERVFAHDVYHCAELNETLGIAGLPQIDLWR